MKTISNHREEPPGAAHAGPPVHATVSLGPVEPPPPPSAPARSYLMLFQAESATMIHLPASGEFVIGRSPEADLHLDQPAVSRFHVKLVIAEDEVRIMDLSRHGTRLNGQALVGAQSLRTGDVISLCGLYLAFYRDARAPRRRPLHDPGALTRRAEEEIARCQRHRRQMSILCVEFAGPPDPPRVDALLRDALAPIDVAAFSGESQLLLLLSESGGDEAASAARRLVAALDPLSPGSRAGFATCPADGDDVDTLIAGARAAAAAAPPGQVLHADQAATTLTLLDRTIIVADLVMLRLYDLIRKLAPSDLPVLFCGETGSGKEVAAAAMHHFSRRSGGPFVPINCAALPEALAEGLLFGHERGAFSGAVTARPGLFSAADGGTVFLDEVGELSPAVQAKLLRVLESRSVLRLGDVKERPINVRLVAATNRDLQKEVQAGRFRQDLYFRLCAATVALPPLRDRRRELPVLARAYLAEALARLGRPPMGLSPGALHALRAYAWPGNLRELRNVIETVAATAQGPLVQPWHLPEHIDQLRPGAAQDVAAPGPPAGPPSFRPLEEEIRELERTRLIEALEVADGVQTRAAELIGMPRRTFLTKCKLYGLLPRRRGLAADGSG